MDTNGPGGSPGRSPRFGLLPKGDLPELSTSACFGRLSTTRHTSARKDIWRVRLSVSTVARVTALLLAEPEPTMRGFLERQLRSDGFDVLAFPSTDELPRAADPDVLVLGDPDA